MSGQREYSSLVDYSNGNLFSIEPDGALYTIDNIIKYIRNGKQYEATYANSALAQSSSILIYLKAHATKTEKYSFKVSDIQFEKNTTIEVFKNPTITADGTLITTYNFDTNSTETFPINVYHTPTVDGINYGTQIVPTITKYVSSTLPNITQINNGNIEYSRILSYDNSYLLKITNIDDAAEIVSLTMLFTDCLS